MNRYGKVLQIAFTYMGTVVGAGFATGQEILQFFTRYGWPAAGTILFATVLFIWLGTKMMLMSAETGARSYEDLNITLFGSRAGEWISLFTLLMLFGVTTVMLAGAGSLLEEHVRIPYGAGLLITLLLTYVLLHRGMDAILTVNSVVVPIMLLFTGAVVWTTFHLPGSGAWLHLPSTASPWRVAFSPILYASYNLAMAQAVLVPLGSTIRDRRTLLAGGVLGGIGIGVMLFACHYALSAQMPSVLHYEIPMGHLIRPLGQTVQLLYVLVIFGEILTTFLSNVYGLALQLETRTRLGRQTLILLILAACYPVSQIGFSRLLAVLYPLFGIVSMAWFVMIVRRRNAWRSRQS